MHKAFVTLTALFGLSGCMIVPAEDALDDAAESELVTTCTGGRCAKLAKPRAIATGGLAVSNNVLYWIALSDTLGEHEPLHEVQWCSLPSCSTVSKLVLRDQDGDPLYENVGLHATRSGKIVFGGFSYRRDGLTKPSRMYQLEGNTLKPLSEFDSDHRSKISIDGDGYVSTNFARDTLEYCPFAPSGIGRCTRGPARHPSDIALTPSKILLLDAQGKVHPFDRTSLARLPDPTFQPARQAQWMLHTVGEQFFVAAWEPNSPVPGIPFDYHTNFDAPDMEDATVGGEVRPLAGSDAQALYLATQHRGDVWGRNKDGDVVRLGTDFSQSVIARGQNPFGVTVTDTKVFWIDADTLETDAPYLEGVIRFRRKR